MNKNGNYLVKFLSVCFGSLLLSCSLMSNEEDNNLDKTLIKQRMQAFLDANIGQPFIGKDFYSSRSYQTNTNYFNGRYQLQNDPRVEIILTVSNKDNYTNLINTDTKIRDYHRLVNTLAISDQTSKFAQAYFKPEFIHTHSWTEADNYRIQIYVIDKVAPETIASYIEAMDNITSEINQTVDVVKGHYYEVVLNLFQEKFKIPTYEKRNGYKDYNGPTGDYIIKANISNDNSITIISRIGFNSKLDYKFKKEIASRYGLDSPNNVHHFSIHKDVYPEDTDENGTRHYARYLVPIYDRAKENVIRREYLKINVFTGEITNFIPKED